MVNLADGQDIILIFFVSDETVYYRQTNIVRIKLLNETILIISSFSSTLSTVPQPLY